MKNRQAGFSLIELVVVLLLGSMIVLMVGQLYAMSVRSAVRQERDAAAINQQVFGIDGLMANLRLAGIGIDKSVLSEVNPQGVLINTSQLAWQNKDGKSLSDYLTMTGKTTKNTHTNTPSDQLTIIYRAPQNMWNCEGNMVLGPRQVRLKNGEMAQIDGQVVIERYFIQQDGAESNLRCNVARFVPEDIERDGTRDAKFSQSSTPFINAIIDKEAKDTKNANVIFDLDGGGDVVAPNVEGMWLRLGVQTAAGVRLISPNQYASFQGAPIVSLDLALLSTESSLRADESEARDFEVFGKTIRLTDNAPNQHRQVHYLSVALRNVQTDGGAP